VEAIIFILFVILAMFETDLRRIETAGLEGDTLFQRGHVSLDWSHPKHLQEKTRSNSTLWPCNHHIVSFHSKRDIDYADY
jgi:hypothetical protein